MANRARRIPDLPLANTIANTDLIVMERRVSNTATTTVAISGESIVNVITHNVGAVVDPAVAIRAANSENQE